MIMLQSMFVRRQSFHHSILGSVLNTMVAATAVVALLLLSGGTTPITTTAEATVVVNPDDSKILIHIPFGMHKPNGFDHIKADFGFGSILNDYQSLSAYVYYIPEVLCYPLSNHSVGFPTLPSGGFYQSPFILFINGGGSCSHVTKVRNAQMIGAAAVILGQPKCSCTDHDCTRLYSPDPHNVADDPCESDESLMTVLTNDGSASDISVPSFYLMKTDSDRLKTTLTETPQQPVLMELQWGITDTFMNSHSTTPSPDQKNVTIQLWSLAYDPHVNVDTYADLRVITSAFSEYNIQFVPQYSIIDGNRYNCVDTADDNSPCDHLCTNHGRYCTNHGANLTGRAIVNETVRRVCIYKESTNAGNGKGNNKHDMYWDYILYHKEKCSVSPSTFDESCSQEAMKHAKIKEKSIVDCMTDSGGIVDDATNTILESAISNQRRMGVVTTPTLIFNNHTLRNRASAYALFDVICNEYWMSNVRVVPEICTQCASCPNTVGCVKNHGKCVGFDNKDRYVVPENTDTKSKPKKKSHFWSILGWMLFFGGAFGAAYYYYETHIKDARRSGSRPLMNDYLHLNVDG